MKVKCPLIVSNGDGGCRRHGCGYRCDRHFMLEVEIPTADLLAELEKRRPCERCDRAGCITCLWAAIGIINNSPKSTDNFKPSK